MNRGTGRRISRQARDAAGETPLVVGWKEWAALPKIGVKKIQAKMDTGARTSALHAPRIALFQKNDTAWVHFALDDDAPEDIENLPHSAPLKDVRDVKSSSGHVERRYLIETVLRLAKMEWPIEITLTDRSDMKSPLLIGRSAMAGRLVIDPAKMFVTGGRRPRTTDDEE